METTPASSETVVLITAMPLLWVRMQRNTTFPMLLSPSGLLDHTRRFSGMSVLTMPGDTHTDSVRYLLVASRTSLRSASR